MSHLEGQLAEFVFEELSAGDMQSAERHVAQCLECQGRVADFRRIQHRLEQLPDADLPRRIVLVPEAAPRVVSGPWSRLSWAWAVPGAVAAAVVFALVFAGPLEVDWSGPGLRVAFGDRTLSPPAVDAPAPDYDALDYAEIASRLAADREQWLEAAMAEYRAESAARFADLVDRLAGLDEDNRQEIRRVRAELSGLFDLQQVLLRESYDQNAALQLVAHQAGLE